MIEIELKPQIDDTLTDISLVHDPAIESLFLLFSKEKKTFCFSSDEKQILTGAVLIPEMRIYRRDGDDEYNVYFSADTVRTLSQQFLANEKNHSFTLEHGEKTEDVCLVESWIVEDSEKDKSAALGLDLPVGSWVMSVKINSQELWNEIKEGKFRGFSIAGLFKQEMSEKERIIKEAEEFIQNQD